VETSVYFLTMYSFLSRIANHWDDQDYLEAGDVDEDSTSDIILCLMPRLPKALSISFSFLWDVAYHGACMTMVRVIVTTQ
jgi:hypothetical protein